MRIVYVGGAGRLGLPLAALSAAKGHHVIVADINVEEVGKINVGGICRMEPRVDELVMQAVQDRFLRATPYIGAAAAQAELICIIVPTPSLQGGGFSNECVLAACQEIGRGLRASPFDYPVVGISSTVMPGATMGPICKALEDASGMKVGEGFGLVYSPEFIRQGSIIQDFSHPDMVLMGTSDLRAADIMWRYYESVIENDAPVHVMSPVSAEIAKLSLNATVVAKMAMANTIAALCHVTPGADAQDVLGVVGDDSRIGAKFFSAGTWPGGPCFPRDTRALAKSLVDAGVPAPVVAGVDVQRGMMALWVARIIGQMASTTKNVGILGLAYKPGVDIAEESQGMALADMLEAGDVSVYTHDPVIKDQFPARQKELADVVAGCDILVLMTCWPEYLQLLEMNLDGKIILDMWGFLTAPHGGMRAGFEDSVLYYRFGEGL